MPRPGRFAVNFRMLPLQPRASDVWVKCYLTGAHEAANAGAVANLEVTASLGADLCHNTHNLMPARNQQSRTMLCLAVSMPGRLSVPNLFAPKHPLSVPTALHSTSCRQARVGPQGCFLPGASPLTKPAGWATASPWDHGKLGVAPLVLDLVEV